MTDNDWKKERRRGIGGSDAAAILGLSPWKSQMDVWLEKMGMAEETADPNRQFLLDLGNDLEPVIAKLYERRTQRHLYAPIVKRVQHPTEPFLAGTPDRLVQGELRGVELKSENEFTDQFGEPGTDQVPYHYLVQCAHYMAVTDYPVWDVALLHGGAAFSIYTIERDMELERDMIDQLRAWWERHIVAKEPPDVDGSGAWKVYLRKKFPSGILPVKDADEETLVLVNNLSTIRRIVEEYTTLEDELTTRIKLVIGEHEGISGNFGKITWKKTKDGTTTNYAKVVDDVRRVMRTSLENASCPLSADVFDQLLDAAIRACSEPRPGYRRFLFKPRKGWTYGNGIEQHPLAAPGLSLPGDGQHRLSGAGEGDDRGALHHGGTAPEGPGPRALKADEGV